MTSKEIQKIRKLEKEGKIDLTKYEDVAEQFENIKPSKEIQEIEKGCGVRIIDDQYNCGEIDCFKVNHLCARCQTRKDQRLKDEAQFKDLIEQHLNYQIEFLTNLLASLDTPTQTKPYNELSMTNPNEDTLKDVGVKDKIVSEKPINKEKKK